MSVLGKSSLSIRKQDVREQKNLAVGFKKLTFAHKATLNDTSISLSSLTIPTEMSSLGFTNPTSGELLAAQLQFYRKNLTLVSSIRGPLMDYLSYDVASSSTINFNGFAAADGEIFIGTIDYNARNGFPLVDAAPLVSTGTLAVGVTDFNVGQLFEINKYSSQQVGAVSVFRNGLQQFRNSNNSSVTLDGNYYEVNNGSGSGQIIRFNSAPSGDADSILVVSNGLLAYNPDGSALQQIETLGGQIDAMIPTLAALSGQPQSNFQTAPNNTDLKSFGDTVINQGSRLTTLEAQTQKWITAAFANGQAISNSSTTVGNLTSIATSGFSTSGNAIILPVDAFYCFAANTSWGNSATGHRELALQYSTNAGGSWSSFLVANVAGTAPVGGGAGGPQITGGRFFNAGVWIRGTVWQDSGGSLSLVPDDSQNNINIWLGGRK
jgi:hypothetical protein